MSSRIENLTAAVVGTGFIGPVHVEGLRRAGVHVAGIVGIVGSTPDKSQAAMSRPSVPICEPCMGHGSVRAAASKHFPARARHRATPSR